MSHITAPRLYYRHAYHLLIIVNLNVCFYITGQQLSDLCKVKRQSRVFPIVGAYPLQNRSL